MYSVTPTSNVVSFAIERRSSLLFVLSDITLSTTLFYYFYSHRMMNRCYAVRKVKKVFNKGELAERLGFPSLIYSFEKSYKFYADTSVEIWDFVLKNGIRSYDIGVKRAQLKQVRIPGSVLLVDECQDLDACQVDLIANQSQFGTLIVLSLVEIFC